MGKSICAALSLICATSLCAQGSPDKVDELLEVIDGLAMSPCAYVVHDSSIDLDGDGPHGDLVRQVNRLMDVRPTPRGEFAKVAKQIAAIQLGPQTLALTESNFRFGRTMRVLHEPGFLLQEVWPRNFDGIHAYLACPEFQLLYLADGRQLNVYLEGTRTAFLRSAPPDLFFPIAITRSGVAPLRRLDWRVVPSDEQIDYRGGDDASPGRYGVTIECDRNNPSLPVAARTKNSNSRVFGMFSYGTASTEEGAGGSVFFERALVFTLVDGSLNLRIRKIEDYKPTFAAGVDDKIFVQGGVKVMVHGLAGVRGMLPTNDSGPWPPHVWKHIEWLKQK